MEIGEGAALACHAIQVGGARELAAKRADVGVAKVIAKHHHQVR
jgi:hypothetical protein